MTEVDIQHSQRTNVAAPAQSYPSHGPSMHYAENVEAMSTMRNTDESMHRCCDQCQAHLNNPFTVNRDKRQVAQNLDPFSSTNYKRIKQEASSTSAVPQQYTPKIRAPELAGSAATMSHANQASPSSPQTNQWTTAPVILLVEDDLVCQRLSTKFLNKLGCQVAVAGDGVSAVNLVRLRTKE